MLTPIVVYRYESGVLVPIVVYKWSVGLDVDISHLPTLPTYSGYNYWMVGAAEGYNLGQIDQYAECTLFTIADIAADESSIGDPMTDTQIGLFTVASGYPGIGVRRYFWDSSDPTVWTLTYTGTLGWGTLGSGYAVNSNFDIYKGDYFTRTTTTIYCPLPPIVPTIIQRYT